MTAVQDVSLRSLPGGMAVLTAMNLVASSAHFAHNAEFIAFYPGLPSWMTREKVYLAWLAITRIGVAGLVVRRLGWPASGVALLGIHGAFGLDGLGYDSLALCSEHTLVTNLTIWSEAVAGFALMSASVVRLASRRERFVSSAVRPS